MTNCTKCTINEIVKEYMCEQCYTEHNEWLRLKPQLDDDQWYTLYESGVR